MSDQAALVALFALLYLPLMVYSASVFAYGSPPSDARMHATRGIYGLMTQVVFVGVLVLTWTIGWWTGEDVGYHGIGGAYQGALAYLVYTWMYRRWHTWFPSHRDLHAEARALKQMWPREPLPKVASAATLFVNPFTEELITRGVFVVVVSTLTGSVWIGIAVGLVVNQFVHAYQGARNLPWQALMYFMTVFLIFVGGGLSAAIVMHIFGDVTHAFPSRSLRQLKEARAWYRENPPAA